MAGRSGAASRERRGTRRQALAGVDRMTIPPQLLELLRKEGDLERSGRAWEGEAS